MISCKHCSTQNSLDSTFCRKCGTEISEIDVTEARAKLDVLVAEGNTAFNEGRTDEALAVAESVLIADPNSIPALWLKAICHERRDQLADALECADRIVELNPDSELDKIRRNQLRTKLSSSLQVYERPDRRVALVGAVAAGVLVLCVGALAANVMRDRPTTDSSKLVASNTGLQQQDPTNSVGGQQTLQQPVTGNSVMTQPGAGQPVTSPSGQDQLGPGDERPLGGGVERPAPSGQNGVIKLPEFKGEVLPEVDGNTRAVDPNSNIKIEPMTVPNTAVKKSTPEEDPDVQPPVNTIAAPAENTGGTIDISVSKGSGQPSTVSSGSNGIQARVITANQAYLVGDFGKAASLFEQAIREGGDPITLNQRLGQAFERLGRTGDAIEAYRRSAQSGEAALNSGKGNPDRIRSAVESAQQALRKLGG